MTKRSILLEKSFCSELEQIPFISTHCHPPDTQPYPDVDALWKSKIYPMFHMSNGWRPATNDQRTALQCTTRHEEKTHQHLYRTRLWLQTLREVFDYTGDQLTREGLAAILPRINEYRGEDFIAVTHRGMDLANIAMQIVDSLPPEQCTPRIRSVGFLDTLLPERGNLPNGRTFANYLADTADQIRAWQRVGMIGVKTHLAYRRTLTISDPGEADARHAYATLSDVTTPENRRILEDFLLRHLLRQCNEISLPVQIHTGFGWSGGKPLHLENADVCHLIPLFEHPDFRNIRFMIFHGSWPYVGEMAYLANMYENVYLDYNCLAYLAGDMMERILSDWLDFVPLHKLMTGTDAPCLISWIIGARENRRLLARVLSRKVTAGLYSELLAMDAAHAILHANAEEAYGINISEFTDHQKNH